MNNQHMPAAVQKKPFTAPLLRREAALPLVTAGSFDLPF